MALSSIGIPGHVPHSSAIVVMFVYIFVGMGLMTLIAEDALALYQIYKTFHEYDSYIEEPLDGSDSPRLAAPPRPPLHRAGSSRLDPALLSINAAVFHVLNVGHRHRNGSHELAPVESGAVT